jgi:hypothetical protein
MLSALILADGEPGYKSDEYPAWVRTALLGARCSSICLAKQNVRQEYTDAIHQIHVNYLDCVPSAMRTAYGSIFRAFPRMLYDSNGAPVYDADRFPDYAAWQVLARKETELMARAEKTRPSVEGACADVQKSRALWLPWIELGEIGLKALALGAGYWALIGLGRVARWVYRGFLAA